jgi:hypothetical protein
MAPHWHIFQAIGSAIYHRVFGVVSLLYYVVTVLAVLAAAVAVVVVSL